MRRYLSILLVLLSTNVYSQDYYDSDPRNSINIDFDEGVSEEMKGNFEGFNFKTRFSNVRGLPTRDYVATSSASSFISIEMKNIGRIALHAKLFNKTDKTLYNSSRKRKGTVTISLFRNEKLLENSSHVVNFSEDIYKQIYFATRKAGIDKVEIDFSSKMDLFILDELVIVPYTEKGATYYGKMEKSEELISDITKDMKDESITIKKNYEHQLGKIQVAYDKLTALINGNKFQNVATAQANSLNPFKSEKFLLHYGEILKMASEAEKTEFNKLSSDLQESNINNVAASIDNILTGGKFSSLINLVDGLFSRSIDLKHEGEAAIIKMGVTYYNQRDLSAGRIRLQPVTDRLVLDEISDLTEKNQAFKDYISIMIKMMKEDLDVLSELNRDVEVAKKLRAELETLTWNIIKDFTAKPKTELLPSSGIDFLKIGLELEKNFKPEELEINSLKKLRTNSIVSIIKFNDLIGQFESVTSLIKTHYDLIYETRPQERRKVFDPLRKHLSEIVSDWKDNQDLVVAEYSKEGGLKQYLTSATGLE